MRKGLLFAAFILTAPLSLMGQSLPRFGLGVVVGSTGIGIQGATAVSRRSNLRMGANYFRYGVDFDKDGITYDATLKLRSGEVLYDQFIGGVFHISPGLMFYDGNQASGGAHVPAGQAFTLGGRTFYSDPASPVGGTGLIQARKTAPEILVGFGNLLPRNEKRFSVNFELGVVFQGSPNAALDLNGRACLAPGSGCETVSSSSIVQASIRAEQDKLNHDLSFYKYYPVVRLSLGYKF